MDAQELAMFEESVAALVSQSDGPALTASLDAFGWLDILNQDPMTGVPVVFTAQGRAVVWSSALHDVMGARLEELDETGTPEEISVVLPLPGSEVPGERKGPTVSVDGLLVGARAGARRLVTAAIDHDGKTVILQFARDDVQVSRRHGLDPAAGVARVTGSANVQSVLAAGEEALSWWRASVAVARRALSHQLCGVLTTMIELARVHAIEREQFGRPIGSFQAVRHKLAEAHVVLTGAEALACVSWESDESDLPSMVAKIAAGRACSIVAAHTQQVLAGIGFTAAHPYHRAMKRAVLIDRILGSTADLAPLAGRALVEQGRAPRLVEL
jgi:acyl-CoA dehydrogenase-like protein